MKILMPTTEFPPDAGGVATLAYEQAAGLARLGFQVQVEAVDHGQATQRPQPPPQAMFRYRPIPAGPVWRLLPLLNDLLRTVRTSQPDFICCPTYRGFGLPVSLVARLTGIPYSIFLHGTELNTERRSKGRLRAMDFVLRKAAFVATNSRNTLRIVRESFPTVTRTKVLLPGVHADRFTSPVLAEEGGRLRAEWLGCMGRPAEGEPVILVSLCRMVREKGIDLVLEAVAMLARRRPDLPLYYVAVGGGTDLLEFRQLSVELGIADKVIFPGPLPYSKSPSALKAADLYVQPSQPVGQFLESFGISFLEAQAAGLPCIGSDWGGVPEAVTKDETALLVPTGNAEAIAGAIEAIASDPALRRRMSEQAARRAQAMSWARHAEQLAEAIRESEST